MDKKQYEKVIENRERYNNLVVFRNQIDEAFNNPNTVIEIDFSLVPSVLAKEEVQRGNCIIHKGGTLSTNEEEVQKLLQPILDYCFNRELEINKEFEEI